MYVSQKWNVYIIPIQLTDSYFVENVHFVGGFESWNMLYFADYYSLHTQYG